MTFGFSDGSRNFLKLFSVFWEVLVFDGWYHGCVSVIVSRFTVLTENFVICCHQITELFCKRCCFANASSARSPCHLGSQAYFAISVFREVSMNTVIPECHFCRTFRTRVMRNVCGCTHFCIFEIISELLKPFWQVSQTVVRGSIGIPLCFFISVLGFWWLAPVSWCGFVTSLCCWTWRCTWWVLW